MAQIIHNISSPNDGLGDKLRVAFDHQNEMNTELYTNKVDKLDGFGLSENNLTDALVATIESLSTNVPTLQEVLDNNHDLINGNNFQGTGAGSGGGAIGINKIGFGTDALKNNSGNDVNGFGNGVGKSGEHSHVNIFGKNATTDADNQTVFSKEGSVMARISYNGITADRKYELPDKDGTFAMLSDTSKSEYKTASFTAEKGAYYVCFNTSMVVTDPATATNGDCFIIFSHYPITIGGVLRIEQSFIYRNYYGGLWQNIDLTNRNEIVALQTDINTRTKTVIKNTTAGSTITGTTAETLVGTYLIPANTFSANDIMRISSFLAEKTGTAGTVTMRIKVGTTATFGSATTIATYTTGVAELWCIMQRMSITLRGGNLRTLLTTSSRNTDLAATSVAISTVAFNTPSDNYIFTSLQLSVGTDSVFQSNLLITN